MTVYWGTSVVYNDWIIVDIFNPYFLYTRPTFMYRYCYNRWYHNYGWNSYWDGPSRYKYKGGDYYHAAKPQVRRGYEVVSNDHSKYLKLKYYEGDKEKRIAKYKESYGFDVKTKTFDTGKYRQSDEPGKKKYYNADSYGDKKKGSDDRGDYGKKQSGDKRIYDDGAVKRGRDDAGCGYEGKKGSSGTQTKDGGWDNRKPERPSGGDVKKQPQGRPEQKGRTDAPQAKPKSESGDKNNQPEAKGRSGDSGSSKPSGGSSPKPAEKPSGGGKKH